VQHHEEEEFRAFVLGSRSRLERTAYALCGDQGRAEDLVQSALIRTYRAWRRIERRDAPEAYARKIVVNLYAGSWRTRRPSEHLTAAVPEHPGADRHAEVDLRDALWRVLATLPPRMRAVIVLRYLEDLKESEVAEVLGCSVGTVKSQASRALDKLHVAWQAQESPVAAVQAPRPVIARNTLEASDGHP
jgi:RNA polymerase sigma-70 factor (sigma-E family)